MTFQFQSLLKAGDTLSQICGLGEDIVLAIITGVVEPPYRPVGAIMGGSFEGFFMMALKNATRQEQRHG